jgi:hypothetical protein
VADLDGGDAVHGLAKYAVAWVAGQVLFGLGQRYGGADLDVVLGDGYLVETGNGLDVKQMARLLVPLAHLHEEVGSAGQDACRFAVGGK